jgi:ubiquinone/menaquinone biosynthesis C-methylase UbiE
MVEDQFGKTLATYNAIAAEYEQKSYGLDPMLDLPGFTELLPLQGRVLDAGCGYGRELKYFTDHGFDTYGIDLSDEMLRLARRRAPQARISMGSVSRLDFDDSFFDGVWCRGVLHHLPRTDIIPALMEFRRVLKASGVVFAHLREGEGEVTIQEDLSSGSDRTFTQVSQEELEEMLQRAGFSVVNSYRYNDNERYGNGRDVSFVVVLGRKT